MLEIDRKMRDIKYRYYKAYYYYKSSSSKLSEQKKGRSIMQLRDYIHAISSDSKDDISYFQVYCNFLLNKLDNLPDFFLVIDCTSTCCLLSKPELLTELGKISKDLNLLTNGESATTNMIGKFLDKILVWYSSNSITKILSYY